MNPNWAPIDHYSDGWLRREARAKTLRSDAAKRELERRATAQASDD